MLSDLGGDALKVARVGLDLGVGTPGRTMQPGDDLSLLRYDVAERYLALVDMVLREMRPLGPRPKRALRKFTGLTG